MIVELLGTGWDWLTLLGTLPLIGMAKDDDDDNDDDDDDDKNKGKMVSMSQKALNSLIDDRAGAIRTTIENEYKGKIETLNTTLKELQGKIDAKPDEDDDKPDKNAIDAAIDKATDNFQTKIKELEGEVTEAKNNATVEIEKRKQETKRALVGNSLSNLKVINPDEVFAVLEHTKSIGFDKDGNLVPITPGGEPVIGDGGEPVPLDKFLTEYIDARPHLVSASNRAGSDADRGGGGGADDTTPKDNENFMRDALDEADKQEAAGLQTHGKKPIESH